MTSQLVAAEKLVVFSSSFSEVFLTYMNHTGCMNNTSINLLSSKWKGTLAIHTYDGNWGSVW
jgi:hypothetical protein